MRRKLFPTPRTVLRPAYQTLTVAYWFKSPRIKLQSRTYKIAMTHVLGLLDQCNKAGAERNLFCVIQKFSLFFCFLTRKTLFLCPEEKEIALDFQK